MAFDLTTSKFKFIGGDASLDYVNTVSGRRSNPDKKSGRDYYDAPRVDKLEDFGDLLTWCVKAGIFTEPEAGYLLTLAEKEPATAVKALKRARVLRESLYRIFTSVVEEWQPEVEDVGRFNKELAIARRHQTLEPEGSQFLFKWTDRENALDSMLWQIAVSASETLTTADLSRLRQCRSDDCRWMFLDTSRNRSRNWCDMSDCGNLAKVRRFRQKKT